LNGGGDNSCRCSNKDFTVAPNRGSDFATIDCEIEERPNNSVCDKMEEDNHYQDTVRSKDSVSNCGRDGNGGGGVGSHESDTDFSTASSFDKDKNIYASCYKDTSKRFNSLWCFGFQTGVGARGLDSRFISRY
jgi:hypothetical protein